MRETMAASEFQFKPSVLSASHTLTLSEDAAALSVEGGKEKISLRFDDMARLRFTKLSAKGAVEYRFELQVNAGRVMVLKFQDPIISRKSEKKRYQLAVTALAAKISRARPDLGFVTGDGQLVKWFQTGLGVFLILIMLSGLLIYWRYGLPDVEPIGLLPLGFVGLLGGYFISVGRLWARSKEVDGALFIEKINRL